MAETPSAPMSSEEISELNRSTAETQRLALKVPRGMCDDVAVLHEPFAELSCELVEGHEGDHKAFILTQANRRAFVHWQEQP